MGQGSGADASPLSSSGFFQTSLGRFLGIRRHNQSSGSFVHSTLPQLGIYNPAHPERQFGLPNTLLCSQLVTKASDVGNVLIVYKESLQGWSRIPGALFLLAPGTSEELF